MVKFNNAMHERPSRKRKSMNKTKWKCEYCSQTFSANSNLKRHLTDKPSVRCNCGILFQSQDSLRNHILEKHGGKEPESASTSATIRRRRLNINMCPAKYLKDIAINASVGSLPKKSIKTRKHSNATKASGNKSRGKRRSDNTSENKNQDSADADYDKNKKVKHRSDNISETKRQNSSENEHTNSSNKKVSNTVTSSTLPSLQESTTAPVIVLKSDVGVMHEQQAIFKTHSSVSEAAPPITKIINSTVASSDLKLGACKISPTGLQASSSGGTQSNNQTIPQSLLSPKQPSVNCLSDASPKNFKNTDISLGAANTTTNCQTSPTRQENAVAQPTKIVNISMKLGLSDTDENDETTIYIKRKNWKKAKKTI